MILSEKHFQILDTLDSQEISTQRQLAQYTGISLGQINYVLKYLLLKGLVKIDHFRTNPQKIGYAYFLTPKGIETKSKLAARFIISKLEEYNNICNKLTETLTAIEKNGHKHIIFIGPEIVKKAVLSVIYEKGLDLILLAYCKDWQDIKKYDNESFDMVVEFSRNQGGKAKNFFGISSDRVVSLC